MTDVLHNNRVRAEIDPERGARLIALAIDGHEVLGRAQDAEVDPAIADGCFPMVPWAGRIRDGQLTAHGQTYQLPVDHEGNALHGLGHDIPWRRRDTGSYDARIGAPWPTQGMARLTYTLLESGLHIQLEWDDGTQEPCSIGMHPWFMRRLDIGAALELSLEPEQMVERGPDGLPTGKLLEPRPGPWDDCFRLRSDPVLTWPGALRLRLSSSTCWWVVYDQPAGTVCVEPQTAPPDAFSHPALQPASGWPRALWFQLSAQDQ